MSANLNAPALSGGQANPETTVNDAVGALDAALTENLAINLNASLTLTSLQYQRAIRLQVTTSAAAQTLTLPAIKRLLMVQNDSANTITVAVGATNFALATNSSSMIYTDGTVNGLKQLSLSGIGGGAGSIPFDLGVYVPGKPNAGATVLSFNVVRAFTLPINLTGSISKSGVAALASATFTIKQNGASIGTFNFGAGASTATFVFAAPVTFAVTDLITVIAPAVQDTNLSDVSLTLLGTQTGTTGPQGIQGVGGVQGTPGVQGNDGEDAQMIPAVGLQGNPGDRGFQGRPGGDGDDGDQGPPGPGYYGPLALTEAAFVKAGAFVAADVPVGQWMVGRDTVNLTTKVYYNNAGVLMSVALT